MRHGGRPAQAAVRDGHAWRPRCDVARSSACGARRRARATEDRVGTQLRCRAAAGPDQAFCTRVTVQHRHSRRELDEAVESVLWWPSAVTFLVLGLTYSLMSEPLTI